MSLARQQILHRQRINMQQQRHCWERCSLWSAPRPLLCNGVVNTSLQQQLNYNRRAVFSTWFVWHSKAGQKNSSSLRHIRWQWQVPPQWNTGSLRPYPNMTSRQQVSQFGPLMQFASRQNVESSSNGSTADYDRV
jgi:hypothetical protein